VKIIRIEIALGDHSIMVSQHQYLKSVLQKERIDHANPVGMPLDPNVMLKPNPDGSQRDQSNLYARLIGELQFITNATRPDITHAVSKLSFYMANPMLQHVSALKQVLRYLSGTKTYRITYSDILDHPNQFFRYTDTMFANTNKHKSTTRYVFKMARGAVTWYSKKKSIIALSSTEAEYITLLEAAWKACWLRTLLKELGFTQALPTMI